MDTLLTDPRVRATTFLVIDFETLTPAGRPPEPIEVAVLALRVHDGELRERARFEALIRPPADVPVTGLDVLQTGITERSLRDAAPAAEVLAELDALLTGPPYRLVAHHAPTEAGIIAHRAANCPVLAATPLIDTVRLARKAVTGLSSHRLDNLLGYYGIPIPVGRHRAMPDVEVTAQVFARLIQDGPATGQWRTLLDLDAAGGRPPKQPATERDAEQGALF